MLNLSRTLFVAAGLCLVNSLSFANDSNQLQAKAEKRLLALGKKAMQNKSVYWRFNLESVHSNARKKETVISSEIWQDVGKNKFWCSGEKRGRRGFVLLNENGFYSWSEKEGKLYGKVRNRGRNDFLPGLTIKNFFSVGTNIFMLQASDGYSELPTLFDLSIDKTAKVKENEICFVGTCKAGLKDTECYGPETVIKLTLNKNNGLVTAFEFGDKRRKVLSKALEIKVNSDLPKGIFEAPTAN